MITSGNGSTIKKKIQYKNGKSVTFNQNTVKISIAASLIYLYDF